MQQERTPVPRQTTRRATVQDIAALLFLALFTLAFYRQIALGGQILPGVDAFTYFYPYRDYVAQAVRHGHAPLWNPYLFMGVPLIANAQTAVFYPLNLALCPLDGPRLVAWSIVIHVALAAIFSYLYARKSLKLGALPALIGASAFAWGGFLSGMVEHINQLDVSAWFPLLLLLWDLHKQKTRFFSKIGLLIGLGATIALGLLAGHAQSTYICLVGLGVYALLPAIFPTKSTGAPNALKTLARVLLDLAIAVLIGAGLAAIQLAPTMELARLSIRGGGLSYREAVAFSLKPLPRLLRYTFFPPLGGNPADVFGGDFFTEFVAYIGFAPALLAAGGLASWGVECVQNWLIGWLGGGRRGLRAALGKNAAQPARRLLILAGLGLFLALGGYNPLYWPLYKLAPGLGLFRAPARWLFLYAFGAAMLAGVGAEKIANWQMLNRKWRIALSSGLAAATVIELFWASQAMPLAHPTAPEAFSSWRTAPAHIWAAQSQEPLPGRVLSMSALLFDPGDQREIEQVWGRQLDERALYDYLIGAKRKEILAPNLPLARRIYSVDGYDGGVLPLQRYVALQTLFLPPDRRSPDGRLRENLTHIPPSRLLSLLGVRYVLTDKVNDLWIDNVFYDLTFAATLSRDTVTEIATRNTPAFRANALGLVAYVEGAAEKEGPVAEIRLETARGDHILPLYGSQIGENAAARQATRLRWQPAAQVERIEIAAGDNGTLHIQGLSLIDERDGSNAPVLLSTGGQYRLAHSGDVKIYEALDALPRAFVVGEAVWVESDEAALALLADPSFDLAAKVALAGDGAPGRPAGAAQLAAQLTVQKYEPETIRLAVTLNAPGYLVLTDAYYPGWQAAVDGRAVEILRANVHFRAVPLDAGAHRVEFTYRPASYRLGLGISAVTLIGVLLGLMIASRRSRAVEV